MIFKVVHAKEIHILNKKVDFQGLSGFVKTSFKKLPARWNLSYLDSEGDKIAIENQSDLDILCENTQAKSVRITVEGIDEDHLLLRSESSENEEVPEVIEQKKETVATQESAPENPSETSRLLNSSTVVSQSDIEEMIKSKIHEIFPEITKKVAQDVREELTRSSIRMEESRVLPETKTFSAEVNSPSSDVVHHGVTCDGCGTYPIVGIRYKSLIQYDFDFCEKCEATKPHPHAFIKIRRPEQVPKVLVASMIDDENPGAEVNGNFFRPENLKEMFNGSGLKEMLHSFLPHFGGFGRCPRNRRNPCNETKPEDKKEEVPKPESKPETKVETKPEVKPEVPKPEVTKPKVEEFSSAEERNMVMATHLELIFEEKLDRLLKFVTRFPHMNKEQLAEKYIELHFK